MGKGSRSHASHSHASRRTTAGRSRIKAEPAVFRGHITIAAGGFGFVTPDPIPGDNGAEPLPDIFIPPFKLGGAMNRDYVKVTALPPDPRYDRGDGRIAGEVTAVLERSRTTVVGEVVSGSRVRPLDRGMPDDLLISGTLHGAKIGDWVEVELHYDAESIAAYDRRRRFRHGPRVSQTATGEIVRNLGRAGVMQADLDAICVEYRLAPRYTAAQEEEAARLTPRTIDREDLTDRFAVTIDPADAKDYDDAVSVGPSDRPGCVEIGTHIADVAAWIAPGGNFDKEARRRSFTAYLPGRTLNMLPKGLTAQISMRPDINSLTHSVLFDVELATGKVLASRRCHARIRVRQRLNYDEVQEFYDTNKAPAQWSAELAENLRKLREAAKKMREYRKNTEKFLDLAIPEIRVLCDEEHDRILGLSCRQQGESEQLIEECMLAANVAVAQETRIKHIPALYRIHPEPDPEKLDEFSLLSASAYGLPAGDLSSRTACQHYLESLPDDERRQPLLNAFLRSMARASYDPAPALHYGLGKSCYGHFTSPIRRYPDLLTHQQLFALDSTGSPVHNAKAIAALAIDCSAKELNTDDAYYAASDRMKLRYLDEQLEAGHENVFAALVVRTLKSGALIELPELGIQGMIPAEELPGAWRDREAALRKCTPGLVLPVRLDEVDFTKSRALFSPVPQPKEKR